MSRKNSAEEYNENDGANIEMFTPSFISDKEGHSGTGQKTASSSSQARMSVIAAIDKLRASKDVEDISQIYHQGISAIRETLTPIQHRHSTKGVHGSTLGEVISLGRKFDPASVTKGGNVFQLVWAGVSNQVDYIRNKTAPINKRFDKLDGQVCEAIHDAMGATSLGECLKDIHNEAIIALSGVLEAQRQQKEVCGRELLKKRDELAQAVDQSPQYYDIYHQCQSLERDILAVDRAISKTESRIFKIENDVDKLHLLQDGFVQQVSDLKEARELIAEMRHEVEVIGMANGAKDRALLQGGVLKIRERLAILADKQSREAILTMAKASERTLFSDKGLKTIINGRETTAKELQKVHEEGFKTRRGQNALINDGRAKHGIGSSVDSDTRARIRAARRSEQIAGSVNVTSLDETSSSKRKKSK